jgi:hypothetical protein
MIRFAILGLVIVLLWLIGRTQCDAHQIACKDFRRLMLVVLFAAYTSHLFHEFGHWTAGTLLGNEMSMSLNRAWPTNGSYLKESHALYVTIGDPAFTILQALIALFVIEKYRTLYAYPFLVSSFLDRYFPITFATFAEQDEAKISEMLNFRPYTVAIIVCLFLFALVLRGSRTLKLNIKVINAFFVGSVAALLIVIGTNKLLFS